MRKSLMIIVVMIAVLMCGCAKEVKATEPVTETEFEFFVESTPETEVATETQKAETSFVVKDGSVEMYHGDDLYWAWDNTQIGDDAKVIELNELSYRFAVQDGQKVWLIQDRESVELIAENGLVFDYDRHRGRRNLQPLCPQGRVWRLLRL